MVRKLFYLSLFLLSVFPSLLFSQEVWSLQRCIQTAIENNIGIKQAELNVKNALLSERQSKFARIPSLNASTNGGVQFGRTIDPTTNSFDNQTIGFNRMSIDAGVVISDGNRINNAIKQSRLDASVARLDGEATTNDLSLGVANAYLFILMAEEQLENAKQNRALSEKQLSQIDKLIKAGVRPENDRLNILSQLALNEQAIVRAENDVDLGYLNLRNSLLLDASEDFKIAKPDIQPDDASDPDLLKFATVYNQALSSQPQIKAADLREQSALVAVELAKAGFFPTLSAFAQINSSWSSVARRFDSFQTVNVPQNIIFDNTPVTIEFETRQPVFTDYPYLEQIDENFGQAIGLSLRIPIYNNHQNRIALERSQIGVLNARYSAEQSRLQLQSDVQTAVANARAAKKTYEAAKLSADASQTAFDNAQKRFDLGAINTFEYATAKTNLDLAQTELVRSKYDYIFRLKIVDFYLGKEIKF